MRAAEVVVLVTLAAAALGGCGDGAAHAGVAERQAAVDPPKLWFAEALDAEGRSVDGLYLCADQRLKEGLARAAAWVNGRPCQPERDPVDRPGLYAARCEVSGRPFGLTVNRQGDLDRDFTVRVAVKALDGTAQEGGHVRRYRLTGPCPAGWAIGDQARPGRKPTGNALGLVGRYVDLSGLQG